jgi:hypothetical protein
MKKLPFPLIALLSTALVITPAAAQSRGGFGHMPRYGLNPSLSLSAPATSPLQQQTREDYATQLMQSQRDLLQQNPSGTTRQELTIGHELNGYTPQ